MTQNETSKYYKTILDTINSNDYEKGTIYQDLINVEKNVLDAVRRVTEYEKTKNSERLIDKNILEIMHLFANTWKNIYTELFIEKQHNTFAEIFMNKDRKIYVGVMLIIIAIVFFAASK